MSHYPEVNPTTGEFVSSVVRDAIANGHNHDGQYHTKTEVDTRLADKAATSHTHTAADITDLAETVQDIVAALLVAGDNTTISYDDDAGTITINSTGTA